MKFVVAAVAIFAMVQIGYSLNCYAGVPGYTMTVNCDTSCMKEILVKDSTTTAVSYGCTPVDKQDNGCVDITEKAANDETLTRCACNTDMCNSSSVVSSASFLVLTALLMKMAI